MKHLLLSFLTIITVLTQAQIRFEPGYFIDNKGNKVECLIRNAGWLNNPVEFDYKQTADNDEVFTAGLADVSEFSVGGLTYIRADVKIDTSTQSIRTLGRNRYPEWKEQQVFLNVIVDGKADLFVYRSPVLERFFYSVDDAPVTQLVYKQFRVNAASISSNRTYQQQLKNDVACGEVSDAVLRKLRYDERSLERYFLSFNICNGEQPEVARQKTKLRWYITPGVDLARFKIDNDNGYQKAYEDGINFRIGFMAEHPLSFNKGKWAIILEPTFQSYSAGANVRYKSLELPLGLRHYFFLNTNARLFANAFFVADVPVQYDLVWSPTTTYRGNLPSGSLAGGLGFNYRKFSVECRKYFTRSVLDDADRFFFVYDKISFILAYQLR